ncbi:DUF932 domain-containing protein [Candidatus Saccharibacteria bacterium]|nr:DUF932 domain-containing protein [Candidatus Saccharibacteria bacterium]
MTSNIWALRLHEPAYVWWGNPETVQEIGNGRVGVGETATEAAKAINIYDIETRRLPLGYTDGNTFKPVGGYRLVNHNVPWRNDGVMALPKSVKTYVPLQNKTFFDMADAFDFLQLEGVGMVGNNAETTFVQFRLPSYTIGGHPNEQHRAWFFVSDTKSDKGGLVIGQVSTRVVCENTFFMATADIEPLQHTDSLPVYLEFILSAYERTLAQAVVEQAQLNYMFTRKLNSTEIEAALKHIIPTPIPGRNLRTIATILSVSTDDLLTRNVPLDDPKMHKLVEQEQNRYVADIERAADRRNALREGLAEFNDTHPYTANTAYALHNSVTNMVTHGENLKKANGRQLFYADNGVGQIFGERNLIRQRSWEWLKDEL